MKASRYNVLFEAEDLLVAYNSFTGSFLEFGIHDREKVEAMLAVQDDSDDGGDVKALLAEHGFLIADRVDEVTLLEDRNSEWKVAGNVILTIALTQACNFDCPYCFEPHLAKSRMPPDVSERVLRFIEKRIAGAKQLAIDWYGGEPLLAYDLLVSMDKQVTEMCRAAGCSYESSISTNGALLTGVRAEELARETSVRSVRVCIDGPPEMHNGYRPFAGGSGSFDVIWKNLLEAVQHLRVKVRINVDKGNEPHVATLLGMLRDSGLNHPNTVVAIKPIISARIRPRDNAYTPQEWSGVETGLKDLVLDFGLALDGKGEQSCAHCVVFANDQFMIDQRGLLYKCSDGFAPEEAVGRILDGGEFEVEADKMDPWLTFPTMYDQQCRSCAALPLCMGGCTFRRIAFGKNWCGAERYNLEAYAKLRHRQARVAGRAIAAPSLNREALPQVG